jgi:hypothetical protein
MIPSEKKTEHVIKKNYSLGAISNSFIGDPMITVKDYYLTKTKSPIMEASQSCTISGGRFLFQVEQGEPLRVAGDIILDGKRFTVLDIPRTMKQMLVDEEGLLYKKVIADPNGRREILFSDFTTVPLGVKFLGTKPVEYVETKAGYLNYEIIYSGKSDKFLQLIYREYTSDNLIRPAFAQNLTYEADAKTIRFKNLLMELISATNETITFKMLKD